MALNQVSIRLCVGSYTDTFQLFKVTPQPHILHCRVLYHSQPQKFPGYHKVDFTPFGREMAEHRISGCYLPIPKDTVACCSNVRGIGRPSLIDNFCTMFRIHKPNIIVLLETQYAVKQLQRLLSSFLGIIILDFRSPSMAYLVGLCTCGGKTILRWRISSSHHQRSELIRSLRVIHAIRIMLFWLEWS
ncbi:uncharacterized protein LOC110707429 [Chenopodium quinoa]|uniref:uncharacterized protein LOC110707429 n=1 Tax=Chenopodium quinoa TaxID=63459 RepID=UPI000B7833D3|nr:uncharacterized protein LOC110707429 [Chenopodium quinoa]